MARIFLLVVLLLAISAVDAFTNHGVVGHRRGGGGVDIVVRSKKSGPSPDTTTAPATTARCNNSRLHERRWNFNEGQSPWGLKRNAEIWNGRVAQMAFVAVVLQELIQGKGVIQGLQEGDPVNLIGAGVTVFTIVAFTAFLAIKGDDDYVTRYLEEKNLKR